MIQEFGADPKPPDLKIHFLKLFDLNFTRQLSHGDGKKWRFHLAGEDFTQARASAIITENLELIFPAVSRQEKGESLDVVPVGVRNKDRQSDRIRTELTLQRLAEKANSGDGVEDDDFAVGAHFNTTRVAAVTDRARARCWN